MFLSIDRGDVTLLGLLDLLAAFDTADHRILMIISTQHLESVGQLSRGLTHLFLCERRLSSSTGHSQLDFARLWCPTG